MEEKDIKTIQTTRGELRYYRDWDRYEGGVVMQNAQTINLYKQIKNQHPEADEYGVFFAFSNEQFKEGYDKLVKLGHIKEGEKITQDTASGAFGKLESLQAFFKFYEDRDKRISAECDAQEVYFYEYNNHECMFSWDGDKDAYQLIVDYFGEEIAQSIQRL